MKPPRNPFIVSGRMSRPYFCDREAEEQELVRNMVNGVNTVMISPRRMGKTSLIDLALRSPEVADSHIVFFIDILQATSLAEFTYLLGREIFTRLAPLGHRLLRQFLSVVKSIGAQIGFDPVTGTPTFGVQLSDISRPELTLEEIFGFLGQSERRCIVAIDEFQQVALFAEKNVEARLRALIQRQDTTTFIFAGSRRHMLVEMFQRRNRPFYGSARIMDLTPIPCGVYADFAAHMFARRGREIDREGIEAAYRLLDGNTYYLQQVMNGAYAETAEGERCGLDTVTASVRRLLDTSATGYREMLSDMTEPQKRLLYAVALDREVSQPTGGDFVRRHDLRSSSSVQSSLRRLDEADMLVRENGRWRVTDPLLRVWIESVYGTPAWPCPL